MSGEFSIGAYAVVRDRDGRVLLARRREGPEWVLPGGSVESGEAPWETAAREVREETGVEVADLRLVGVYAKREENDIVLLFAAAIEAGGQSPSDERERAGFFTRDELPEELAGRHAERLGDALDDPERPVLRVQPSDHDRPPPGVR